jgi:hypothetical protein
MRQLLKSMYNQIKKFGKGSSVSRKERQARLGLESLEQRTLMSASPLTWTAPAGETGGRSVVLEVVGGNLEVFDNGALVKQQAVASTLSVNLTSGSNADTYFSIMNTVKNIPTTVNFASRYDSAYLGNGVSLQGIQGTLNINGFNGSGSVVMNASTDTGASPVTINAGSVTGLAPATINYSGVNTLDVYGRMSGPNQYTIAGSPGKVVFIGQSNSDTVYLNSTSGNVTVYGRSGDIAIMNGASTGSNTFLATSSRANMSGAGYSNEADGFGQVYAYSHASNDTAELYGASSGVNRLSAQQSYFYMTGNGYNNEALGFSNLQAYSSSPYDSATLYGVNMNADSTLATGGGLGWGFAVHNFPRVTAYGGASGRSTLTADGSGGNTFTSNGIQSTLSGNGYFIEMIDVYNLEVLTTPSATDAAFLDGTASSTDVEFYGMFGDMGGTIRRDGFSTVVLDCSSVVLFKPTSVEYIGNPFPAGTASSSTGNFAGFTTLFALTNSGNLEQLGALGWNTIYTGVKQYQIASFGPYSNSLFFLTTGGSLFVDTGNSWPIAISTPMSVSSFGIGSVSGVNCLVFESTSGFIAYRTNLSSYWHYVGGGFVPAQPILVATSGTGLGFEAARPDGSHWIYQFDGYNFYYSRSV